METPRTEGIAARLESLAEQLADLALDCLREALDAAAPGEDGEAPVPDPVKVAEEHRLTRARRSVEKAAYILRNAGIRPEE